jgi:hypothetical protein
MRKAFQSLTESLTCELCQSGLEKRIKEIVDQWAGVKVSDIYHTYIGFCSDSRRQPTI